MSSFAQRRSTTSARLRENHASTAGPSASGRPQKPHATEAVGEDGTTKAEPNLLRRKKGSSHPVASSSGQGGSMRSQRPSSGAYDGHSEQRRSLHRPVSRNSDVEVPAASETKIPRRHGKAKRRDRSQSRDANNRLSVRVSKAEPAEESASIQRHSRGSTGHDEYQKMKEELDTAKKQAATYKKNMAKQTKVIDDLRKDLANAQHSHQEERKQVEKLQTKSKKNDEAMSTIEANMNCQICMDLLLKPYGLSPCGHVLCLPCLQNWFRTAPAGDDDEMYDDDPDSILYRKKTCPCCRAAVTSRPIPLFLIKSIAVALSKARDPDNATSRSSPPLEGDPWEGIFPDIMSADAMWLDDDDDDGYDPTPFEDYAERYGMPDEYDSEDDEWPYEGYGSDEDAEPYEGEYVPTRWAPPTLDVSANDYPFDDISDEMLSMLRRGATPPMIALFEMSYVHQDGLRALVNGNVVYLGWNIELRPGDETGEEYMEWVEADVYNRPERWERDDNPDGTWTAWRLVREDEDEEYATTDSEAYGEADEDSDAYAEAGDGDDHVYYYLD